MAYYRRRRGGYGGYRRRRDPKTFFKIIGVLLIVAVCAAAVIQTKRLRDTQDAMQALQEQNAAASQSAAASSAQQEQGAQPLPYQTLYPEMKAGGTGVYAEDQPKAIYLTFDDGPSANTSAILDALQEKNQKATFFVVGKNIQGREDILKRMVDEGHTVGIHGYSHDYAQTYASVEDFLEDFHQAYEAVYEACGVYPTVFRFPGGSVNAYNRSVYQQIIAEMLRRGFTYYDWNVSGGDAASGEVAAETILSAVVAGVAENEHPIVLLHDAADKDTTAAAIPALLDDLIGRGYYCDRLTDEVRPITFQYSE